LEQWEEGTAVNLSKELPGIKADIRAARAEEDSKKEKEEDEVAGQL
jgi:G2/mitotic-specific cyclin 2